MLNLVATTDKLQLVTSAAVTVDVHASYADLNGTTVTPGRKNTAITTATTTDIVASPAGSTVRNIKTLHIRNKHASLSTDVTVLYEGSATDADVELHSVTLLPGEMLEYIEGIGFFVVAHDIGVERNLVVTADVTNATTSFADITGLTCPVEANKTYIIEAYIIHINNATTTGSRFGFNGPAMTYVIASTIDTVTASVTASVHSGGTVTALETAITAQTTGSVANTLAIIAGTIVPSAEGTFAMRCASEVAVASGLIVRRGSWLKIREADNA